MSDPFLVKLNEKNLCTWYILPLLELNRQAFGIANFINSFIVEGKMAIAVQVADAQLCREVVQEITFLRQEQLLSGYDLLVFRIPGEWREDFQCFLKGAYSKMSDSAKEMIRRGSGLTYEVRDEKGNRVTDAILMALERHEVLKEKWLEILGRNTPLPEELLSIPQPDSFITIPEGL